MCHDSFYVFLIMKDVAATIIVIAIQIKTFETFCLHSESTSIEHDEVKDPPTR